MQGRWLGASMGLLVACPGGSEGGSDTRAETGTTSSASGSTAPGPTTSGPTATEGGSSSGEVTTGDPDDTGTETGPEGSEPTLEGYGTDSAFGSGGETCTVTNLDDAGPGSLRDCVENRDTTDDAPTPRTVVFEIGGTINLASNLRIRQPFLTVDGLSAPDPGITIEKTGDGSTGGLLLTSWPPMATCGHDVLVQGIRLRGVWPGDTEMHQQVALIGVDGEDLPLCMHHIVLHRVTAIDAQDGAGDLWGSVTDVTVQYSAFLRSQHPNTYSHQPGDVPDQQRERISSHHNLYAHIHERGPQVRGNVWDANFEQNVMHRWDDFGFPGGYAMRLRCRDGVCPQRINVIDNHFTSASASPGEGFILGDVSGPADDGPVTDEAFMSGNWLPPANVDGGSAPAEFPRPPVADVTLVPDEELVDLVVPWIGAPYRPAEEAAIFEEVAATIAADLGG